MTGGELRSLMVDRQLPAEYVTKDNLTVLLEYERDQMQKAKYYDASIMVYCMDALVRNYYFEDRELVMLWGRAFANMKKTVRRISADIEEKPSAVGLIMKMIESVESAGNEEGLQASAGRFLELTKEADAQSENRLPIKARRSRKPLSLATMSRHIHAFVIAVLIAAPVAFIAFNTDIIENIAFFFRGEEYGEVIMVDIRTYDSIEEFEEAHNISFLLPTWLPQSLETEMVKYGDGSLDISYVGTNDNVARLMIEFSADMPATYGAEVHKHNGIVFYIFQEVSTIWWEYEGNFYDIIFGFDISEYVVKIMECIK